MPLSATELDAVLRAQLTDAERAGGVAYVARDPIPAGTTFDYPQGAIQVPWDAWLAFLDREPRANWGHSCRYLLVPVGGGATLSFEARFPPFHRGDVHRWRVWHRAPGLPDTALAVPEP